jgi:hypothetical protein
MVANRFVFWSSQAMDGFHRQEQSLPKRKHCFPRLSLLMAGAAVAFSLCANSGCATMQGAKKDLHLATCGEADAACACSCGECTAKLHAADEATVEGGNVASKHKSGQKDLVTHQNGQAGSGSVDVQPKYMTIEGMPGVWMPDQSATDSGFMESPSEAFDRVANNPGNFQKSSNEQPSGTNTMHGNSAWGGNQPNHSQGAYCPPGMTRTDEELKENRVQIQVLSQQISQMMQMQDSIKASQETLQQAHEREMLEVKLQQATAERDRLERDRELDRELQRQREHNLETIDSFSQIIENVAQIPAPPVTAAGGNLRSVPRTSTRSEQGQPTASQMLPTVDESR